MKITGYNAVVNPNTINAGVRVSGDLNAYGGKGNGARAVSNALGKVQAAYEQVAEEEDKRALMSAMDIYNKGRYDILYNDENGVLNTKLEGAAGSVGNYLEREKKLRNDILGNMKFRTEKYKLVFQDMVGKSAEQGYQLVDRHEYKEMEAQKDLTLNNNLENMLQFAQKNYGDDGIVANAIAQGRLYIAERFGDRGKEFLDKINSQFEGKAGEMLINQAVMAGEFDRADELKSVFDEAFTADQRAKVERLLFTKKQDQYEMSLAENLVARHKENLGAMLAELEGTNAFGSNRLMNLRERQHIFNIAQNIVNTNKAIERAQSNSLCDNASETVIDMLNNGKNYKEAIAWANEQSGADTKTRQTLYRVVNMLYKNIDSKVVALGENEKGLLLDMLQEGKFSNKVAFLEFASEQGATPNELRAMSKHYNDYVNARGEFKYNWGETLKSFELGSKLKGADLSNFKQGLKALAVNYVREYRAAHNGEEPENWEVDKFLQDKLTDTFFVTVKGESTFTNWAGRTSYEFSNLELARVGIKSAREIGENEYEIVYGYDNATMRVSSEYLASLLAGGSQ